MMLDSSQSRCQLQVVVERRDCDSFRWFHWKSHHHQRTDLKHHCSSEGETSVRTWVGPDGFEIGVIVSW